jgi:twitching motility protein PilT
MPRDALDALFHLLVSSGASDLHWCDGEPVRLRVNGFLETAETPDSVRGFDFDALTIQLVGHEKYDRFLQDKEYDGAATIMGGRRIRINIYFKRDKIAWAIRLLPNRFFGLDELGIPLEVCGQLCAMKQGLVLVTGATGSGKTTTLASILNHINRTRREHIFTIEDPVEYVHASALCMVSQREVGHDTRGFHDALRSVLREDPDIVLLGEMRDRVSMDAALTLAETGHLTFATLHTSGAVESIARILSNFEAIEQGQVRERIANNLKVVITQQLVPWTNREGRSLCAEIMVSTKAIRALIRDSKERQMLSLLETGSELGMTTMNKSLADLVRKHLITLDEAALYSPDKDGLMRVV